jgi:hypothetical protein
MMDKYVRVIRAAGGGGVPLVSMLTCIYTSRFAIAWSE